MSEFVDGGLIIGGDMNKANLRNWRLRSAIARSAVAVATVIALAVFELAYADVTVFHDRAAFNAALDTNPLLLKKVEGWDTYPPRTIFLMVRR